MSNVAYLQDKPIVVLGAGAVGKACAAECALAGATVRICELEQFASTNLYNVEKEGIGFSGPQDNLYDFHREGTADIDMATTDVAKAVKGAGIIIVACTAYGHEPFFKQLIPALEDGMVIHIIPDNFGSFVFRRMMREMGCTKKVIVGGWTSSPYGARVAIRGGITMPRVRIGYRAINLRGCALPAKDNDAFMESVQYMGCMDAIRNGDGTTAGETALDIGFSNINPVLHCPGVLLGVSTMENFGVVFGPHNKKEFSIYSHAFCPSISRVQYAFYQEEVTLANTLNCGIQHYKEEQFFSRSNLLGAEFMNENYAIPFDEVYPEAYFTGPYSVQNRYVTEDVPVGCRVYHELGKAYGIKTPTIDSIIQLACIMTEHDYFVEEGLTLDHLGIEGMSIEALGNYLREGN